MRLGTRGSVLARAQSRLIAAALEDLHPGLKIDLNVIRTQGDRDLERPVEVLGGKTVFVSEIEEALQREEIDLAVHSLKDMAAELPEGLELAAIPARVDPADALVSPEGKGLEALPAGARIGTGSPRRTTQLRLARQDLSCVPLRGNVDTRLRLMEEGKVQAVILAVAGLKRLERLDGRAFRLETDSFIPAPGQGALGVETRCGSAASDLVRPLHDETSGREVEAERALVRALGGGCQMPLGALAKLERGRLTLRVFLSDLAAGHWMRDSETGLASDPGSIARRLAARLLSAGGTEILRGLGLTPPDPATLEGC
ncbi:MAG: hydroxymethylbilane synthase [Acidobacteriota bacterium]